MLFQLLILALTHPNRKLWQVLITLLRLMRIYRRPPYNCSIGKRLWLMSYILACSTPLIHVMQYTTTRVQA